MIPGQKKGHMTAVHVNDIVRHLKKLKRKVCPPQWNLFLLPIIQSPILRRNVLSLLSAHMFVADLTPPQFGGGGSTCNSRHGRENITFLKSRWWFQSRPMANHSQWEAMTLLREHWGRGSHIFKLYTWVQRESSSHLASWGEREPVSEGRQHRQMDRETKGLSLWQPKK